MRTRSVGLILVAVVSVGGVTSLAIARRDRPVEYSEARRVVDRRCLECHSAQPTNRAFPIAPQGIMFDTALQMKQHAARIEASVAVERTMPIANMTGMTEEERRILGRWAETGTQIPYGRQ